MQEAKIGISLPVEDHGGAIGAAARILKADLAPEGRAAIQVVAHVTARTVLRVVCTTERPVLSVVDRWSTFQAGAGVGETDLASGTCGGVEVVAIETRGAIDPLVHFAKQSQLRGLVESSGSPLRASADVRLTELEAWTGRRVQVVARIARRTVLSTR